MTKIFRRPKSISHGRPTIAKRPTPSLSSKATRQLIRSHHQLHKARAQAVAEGNEALVSELDKAIVSKGGLESYQLASKKGQSEERGGDSSKVLIDWLDPVLRQLKDDGGCLRVLEIGALSTTNACSRAGNLDVSRIDLHSQEPGILQQDFMERPVPVIDVDKFHVISLSLVLNYVPDLDVRGEMLRRTTSFFASSMPSPGLSTSDFLPSLFLVLPAACVLNSRYFTEDRLGEIMSSLGYLMIRRKVTTKLIYYLWKFESGGTATQRHFKKEVLNPGRIRNNFTVALKSSG